MAPGPAITPSSYHRVQKLHDLARHLNDSARRRPHTQSRARPGLGVLTVTLAFMMVIAFSTSPSPLYGLYKARDGFSSFTITLIYAAYAIGVIISLFFFGHISDSYGRKRVLVPAVVLSIVSALVFLFWRALPGLYVGRIVSGLSVGMVTATATAYLGELYAAHRPEATTRRAQLLATTANLGGSRPGCPAGRTARRYVPAPLHRPLRRVRRPADIRSGRRARQSRDPCRSRAEAPLPATAGVGARPRTRPVLRRPPSGPCSGSPPSVSSPVWPAPS